MRAAVVEKLGAPLVVRDVPAPSCPPDGAIIRVAANGICRTDWALWDGDFWEGGPDLDPPFVLGHEFAGTVESVGASVHGWGHGDRVTFPMNPGDGTCPVCRSGQQQVCEHVAQLVPGVSYPGAFAEYVMVRYADVNLVALPDSLSFTAAAGLGCRYAGAFHGLVDQAGVRGGEWVAVYGAGGGMGLAAVQIATALGASVVAVDLGPQKLEVAREMGAVAVVDAGREDPVSAVTELTGGGAHVSVDAAGLTETCQASIRSLRIRGRHLQLGHTTRAQHGRIPLPVDVMMVRELAVFSGFGMAGHRYDRLLTMIDQGRLDPGRLVSDTVALDSAGDVLAAMRGFDTHGFVVIDRF